MGFNTVAVGTPDDVVLDLVDNILSGGRTSRLYRLLVEQERLAASVRTGNYAGRYPGWFAIQLDLLQGKDRQRAEELVLRELERLAQEEVSPAELARARRKVLAQFIFAADDVHNLANAIARAACYPGGEDVPRFYTTHLERLLQVQPRDIQRVVRQYLQRRQACIVWSVPPAEEKKTGGSSPPPQKGKSQRLFLGEQVLTPAQRPARNPAAAPAANGQQFSLQAAQRHVLPNGLVVWLWEDHRLPLVIVEAEVADVRLREPADKAGVAALMGDLLDEGTRRYTGPQIAELIENTGGSLHMHASGGGFQVLRPDLDTGLSLLFECLIQPTFPAEAFQRVQARQLSRLEDLATQPFQRGLNLFRQKIYGAHPLGRPELGSRATVEKLTPEDCKAFHAATFATNVTTIVAVGDFDSAQMLQKIEEMTRAWKPLPARPLQLPSPPPTSREVQIVSDPKAAQVHVFIGHLGITRNNPDYYKLLVMDNVLGTGPGFTDRLSATLRDRMGLAYTVRATITGNAGKQPGTFSGYIGTFAKSFLDVQRSFLREIERIREEPPTAQEVEDAKKYLLGSMPFRFATRQDLAAQLLAIERYNLGKDYPEIFRREVAKVTPDDVQAVARKYLDPQRLIIVAVGPIDAQGRPLGK